MQGAAAELLDKALAAVAVKIIPETTKSVVEVVAHLVLEVITAVQRLAMAEAEQLQALLDRL
jgi:hypothetical protein